MQFDPCNFVKNPTNIKIFDPIKILTELGTFEWWISGLMLDPRFFS